MKKPPLPLNESDRLKALASYSIMDTLPEKEYDEITQLASYICGTPIALVSLLDKERQWFKSSVGLGASETPREISFCQYAIMGEEVYEVTNALENDLFANNPLVTGNPDIRFYAGAPLKDAGGLNLGSLCVIDTIPRELTEEQKNALRLLANQVVLLLQLRKKNLDLNTTQKEFQNFIELSMDLVCIANVNGLFFKVNPAFTKVLGYSKEELEGTPFVNFVHPDDLEITYKEVVKLTAGHKTISFENRYRCKNGEYIVLSWNASPDPLTGNLYCIARDMTAEKEAELSLLESKKLLDESQNIAKTGSWKFNLITKDLIWSKANYKIFEFEELPANKLFDAYRKLLSPETLARLDIAIGKSVSTGQNFEFLTDIKFSDNRVKYILTLGELIKNECGEVVSAQGSTQDITDKVLAEQKIIDSNQLLDDSENIAKTGSWKFNLGAKEIIISKGHSKIFELDGLPADELYAAYRSRIHYDDLADLDELDKDIIKTGKDYETNYRLLFPDSRIKYILETGRPFKNLNGDIIGIQGSVNDVTEKTLAEQRIAEKAKEINDVRSALDESSIVTITDDRGVITFVNDKFCSISKHSREELIGHYHYVNNPEYQLNKFIKNIWKTIANGKVWKGDIKNRAKDGSYYWVNVTIVPFLDNEGKPYQYIAISSDITEQKLAKEKLDIALVNLGKTNKELDQFAYIVSHDLKAPLRAINNLSEWIVEDMPEMPEMVSDNFGLLRGRVQRMENLINGVLDYSRIGRTKIERESVDIRQMLDQIVETLVPTKDFEVSIKGEFPVIVVAKILLYQVFSNLISNAVKYNDKPIGKIECHYDSIEGFHQFSVKDNGPGIAEEYHKKVFKVFQTIEARDKKESTGVGLSIVQKIIEEKGGSIKIESEENKWVNFIFTLPK